jgi:hypothetical protein
MGTQRPTCRLGSSDGSVAPLVPAPAVPPVASISGSASRVTDESVSVSGWSMALGRIERILPWTTSSSPTSKNRSIWGRFHQRQ